MQEINTTKKEEKNIKIGFKISDLMIEDKQKLVGVFTWLIQEDKTSILRGSIPRAEMPF